MGMVHFFEALSKAKYGILRMALSFGKDPFAFITFLIDRLTDSMALVVYITLRMSSGYSKRGMILSQLGKKTFCNPEIFQKIRSLMNMDDQKL